MRVFILELVYSKASKQTRKRKRVKDEEEEKGLTIDQIIISLSNFNPKVAKYYRWNYSWNQMKELFILKNKEQNDRLQALCSFLVELTSAAFGGKSSSEDVGMDNGEGAEEMTDEQLEMWKQVLGEAEFEKLYGDII